MNIKDAALLAEARKRHAKGVSYDSDNVVEGKTDLQFAASNQWDEDSKAEREAAGRIMITENRISAILAQVVGSLRENKPAIKVRGVDGESDAEIADLHTGLIRGIENQSSSRQPIIRAAESAVHCGIGHFRILTEYTDADSFDQDIVMEPIHDPFAVVWDPDSVMVTREDAKWCFVTQDIEMDAFKEQFPKARTDSFEKGAEAGQHYQHWGGKDKVTIAEYWVKEPIVRRLGMTEDGKVVEVAKGEDESLYKEVRERETYQVKMYKINGHELLEPPVVWQTPHIPIIAVVGEEIHLEDGVYRRGVTRLARGPQVRLNYWLTAQTEWLAMQPKMPYLVSTKQIEGWEAEWAGANDTTSPYLPYNPDPLTPGAPQRSQPPVGASAMYQEVMLAGDALKATTGVFDAALGASSNETSGVAINARKAQSGTGNFVYADNLSKSVEYSGRILLSLIPKIYDTERVVRILGEDGSEKYPVINQTVIVDGEPVVKNDLSQGRYDVTVTTGPAYASRRAEALDSMMQFIQTSPQMAQGVMDLVAKNADWPGADEFVKRLEKMLPPGIKEPDDDDEEAQAAAQQSMQMAQMQQQKAEIAEALAMKEMQAKIAKLDAEIQGIGADTEETKIDTMIKAFEHSIKSGALNQALQLAIHRPPPDQVPLQQPIGITGP